MIEDLKTHLRERSFESEKLFRFVFICGEQILNNDGKIIDSCILEKKNNIRHFIMKKFSKYEVSSDYDKNSKVVQSVISELLYSVDKETDILTFEELLAELSEVIIIVSESAGTYCELGAFALNDLFSKKIIVINEDKPEYKRSFITLGPIKKIESKNANNIILYKNKESLKNSIQLDDTISNIANQKVKYTPNINSQNINLKNLIYELFNILEFFEPITQYELQKLYMQIKDISNYTISNKSKHKIYSIIKVVQLMIDMKLINMKSEYLCANKEFTAYNTMFTIDRKYLNSFRTKYLCRVYKYAPERMEPINGFVRTNE